MAVFVFSDLLLNISWLITQPNSLIEKPFFHLGGCLPVTPKYIATMGAAEKRFLPMATKVFSMLGKAEYNPKTVDFTAFWASKNLGIYKEWHWTWKQKNVSYWFDHLVLSVLQGFFEMNRTNKKVNDAERLAHLLPIDATNGWAWCESTSWLANHHIQTAFSFIMSTARPLLQAAMVGERTFYHSYPLRSSLDFAAPGFGFPPIDPASASFSIRSEPGRLERFIKAVRTAKPPKDTDEPEDNVDTSKETADVKVKAKGKGVRKRADISDGSSPENRKVARTSKTSKNPDPPDLSAQPKESVSWEDAVKHIQNGLFNISDFYLKKITSYMTVSYMLNCSVALASVRCSPTCMCCDC